MGGRLRSRSLRSSTVSADSPDYWYSLALLDEIDLTNQDDAEADRVRTLLPRLRKDLDEARAEVSRALAPVDASHPADDTWDDNIFFHRALRETGHDQKAAALDEASRRLDALTSSRKPGCSIAGWVIDDAHAYVKQLGLAPAGSRATSKPASLANIPPGLPFKLRAHLLVQDPKLLESPPSLPIPLAP